MRREDRSPAGLLPAFAQDFTALTKQPHTTSRLTPETTLQVWQGTATGRGHRRRHSLALTMGERCHQASHVVGTLHMAWSGSRSCVGPVTLYKPQFSHLEKGKTEVLPAQGGREDQTASEHTVRTEYTSEFQILWPCFSFWLQIL